ncbi:YHYH domain-containing protein [Magnetococcales bacterium HHB-1]
MKRLSLLILFIVFMLSPQGVTTVSGHSGGLNKEGCHTKKSTGEYHCHSKKKLKKEGVDVPVEPGIIKEIPEPVQIKKEASKKLGDMAEEAVKKVQDLKIPKIGKKNKRGLDAEEAVTHTTEPKNKIEIPQIGTE